MPSWGAVFGLLSLVLLAAPSGDAKLQRCLDDCASAGSKTDRETCRLTCRQRAEDRGAPIKHWKRTELKGGSPDPNVEGGSTTTTVERGPGGTTTTVTKTDRHGNTTTKRYAGTDAERRARAKGTGRVPFTWARRRQAWCHLGCTAQRSIQARTRCRARCPVPPPTARPTPKSKPKPKPKPKPATTHKTSCQATCRSRRTACEAACPARASARHTCTLQCEQAATTCQKRC